MNTLGSKSTAIKAVSADFIMNIAAVMISTGAMQLLLYPRLAASLGSLEYGTMLTVMGGVNVITLAFGNNLAQVRLIREQQYKDLDEEGDFQVLLFASSALSSLLTAVFCIVVGISMSEIPMIMILSLTTVVKSYYLVAFRISIDYKKNLIANIAMCVGYAIGSFVLLSFLHWSWAFTLANVLCIAYICKVSRIVFEPCRLTDLFGRTSRSYVMLMAGGLLGNMTTYLDRFVVYPILGAASVSSFYVATYFSKAFGLLFPPMASVLLSYFTQGRVKVSKRLFLFMNFGILPCSAVLVAFCVSFGACFTELLFPDMYSEAAPFILLGSIGAVINIACSFNGVVVLAVASPAWQTIIPGICLLVYLALAVLLSLEFGLVGTCVAVIVSNLLRFVLNFIVGMCALANSDIS